MATNPRFWISRSEPLTINETPAGLRFADQAREIVHAIAMELKNDPYVSGIGVLYNSRECSIVFTGVFSSQSADLAKSLAAIVFSDAIRKAGCIDDAAESAEWRVKTLHQLEVAMRDDLSEGGSDDFMYVRELATA